MTPLSPLRVKTCFRTNSGGIAVGRKLYLRGHDKKALKSGGGGLSSQPLGSYGTGWYDSAK